jgi:predicted nucleic acid-binding protein
MIKNSEFDGVRLHCILRCQRAVWIGASNLLMHLALSGLFRAKWSVGVHEEWMAALLRNRPDLSREKLERTRTLMDQHTQDALVSGYEELVEGLQLPDPNDRHVLAAAIRGHADVIVTTNTRHFPVQALRPFGIEPQHPDEFVVNLLDLTPGAVLTAVRRHRESLKNPPKTPEGYLGMRCLILQFGAAAGSP